MAAVNFGGILPRMPDLSHGNGPGYGCVSVTPKPEPDCLTIRDRLWFRGYLSGRNDQRQGMVDD
ncbi:hypothetical protein NC651_038197 [Populus alba x Populus x berolinensis]|nr:hypothetical protein NC651_038197 [Populus alba x Populus x berolinensis]